MPTRITRAPLHSAGNPKTLSVQRNAAQKDDSSFPRLMAKGRAGYLETNPTVSFLPAAMTRTSLTSLPPELFACILDWVPSIDLQQTTSSLLRIFPYGLIPNWRRYLFCHIHLKRAHNVGTLCKHLQRTPGDADFIKKFSLATWTVDADAAINVVLMIPKLEWLSLCIGINFEPEQLRYLFHKPMPNLRYLSLRFRP